MEILVTIFFAVLWGYICYCMAEKRNRDAALGAILGACFGILAVIGYAIAGDKKD